MPIMIPSVTDIQLMDPRQKAAYVKRLPATRQHVADSLAQLRDDLPDMFPNPRDLAAARRRAQHFDAALEVERARALLAARPPDPDVAEHLVALYEALL